MRKLLSTITLALFATLAIAQQNFTVPPDTAGRYPSYVRLAPTYTDVRVLAANVSEAHTVPAGSRFVVFSANCDFYAIVGATAAVPAADVTNGSGSELNPTAWFIEGATQIAFIAPTACVITLSFYK